MKSRLNERDLNRIVRRVINEGVGVAQPLDAYPDGIYKLTRVQGNSGVGEYLKKEGGNMEIYTGNYSLQNGKLIGGGTIFN
jgi:hypothetical protein